MGDVAGPWAGERQRPSLRHCVVTLGPLLCSSGSAPIRASSPIFWLLGTASPFSMSVIFYLLILTLISLLLLFRHHTAEKNAQRQSFLAGTIVGSNGRRAARQWWMTDGASTAVPWAALVIHRSASAPLASLQPLQLLFRPPIWSHTNGGT